MYSLAFFPAGNYVPMPSRLVTRQENPFPTWTPTPFQEPKPFISPIARLSASCREDRSLHPSESATMTGRPNGHPAPVKAPEPLLKDSTHSLGRDEVIKKQESTKSHSKGLSKSPKKVRPTMEIYTPRKLVKNGSKVHFADDSNLCKKQPSPPPSLPTELKSALRKSKSFIADTDSQQLKNLGFEKDIFPIEYHGLIKRAVVDPNVLSCEKLMELVRLICCKAVENSQHTAAAAQLCFSVIEKEHDHTFLESLQNCCREWFNEREKLLRSPVVGSRRWGAYVSFVSELYLRVKEHQGAIMAPLPNSPMAHLALTLQTLLFECITVMIRPAAINSDGEVELVRRMLSSVGCQLENDSTQRMQALVNGLRDAFLHPSVSAQVRKSLLEVIELQASGWELSLSQRLYYFPYTRL